MASTRAARICVIAGAVFAAIALPMAAGAAQAASGDQARAHGQPRLALDVTSVSPSFAQPGQPITIKGRVWNGTRSTLRDLKVRLSFSSSAIYSETALQSFESGTSGPLLLPLSVAPKTIGKLRSRHGVAWQIKLPVDTLRLTCFGVYPLNVGVSDPAGYLTANDRVPLPFWPKTATSCPQAMPHNRFPVSWIWPLIDSPRQGPCPGLLDNTLAASLAPGGRLRSLLDVGAAFANSAHLTWAMDPALLGDAHTMSSRYQVGTSASCANTWHGADRNAATWLAKVKASTAGQPAFVTPYADVDMVSLAGYAYASADLQKSFADGQRLANKLLGRVGKPAQLPGGLKSLSAVAWPAKGKASQTVLQYLGAMRIGTVILAMPPNQTSPTPGAVTSVPDGVGTKLRVLLANNALSGLLASSAAASTQPGTMFSISQQFLAETAIFVAEAPAAQRPILVTPPRRWDPPPSLATNLLNDTVNAPWLRPVPIGALARQPEQQGYVPPAFVPAQLPRKVLRQLAKLDPSVTLLQSIMVNHDANLSHAVYGLESSAWAGDGAAHSEAMLTRTGQYVAKQFAGLSVGGRHVIHVTLGGRVGSVPVSIHSSLRFGVKVGLRVESSNDTVHASQKHLHEVYVVPAGSTEGLKLSVNATQTGKATLRLSLTNPNGTLLPGKPLTMTIKATNLGTVALVIFAAALGVFVVVSAAQAIRRGRPEADDEEHEDQEGELESTAADEDPPAEQEMPITSLPNDPN